MDLRKTVDCVYFLKGQCRNGAACPFKHDSAKSPSGPTALPIAAPAKQSEDCYYFLHGRCAKGNQCFFFHDQTKLKPSPSLDVFTNPSAAPAHAARVSAPIPPVGAPPPAKVLGTAAQPQPAKNSPLGNREVQAVDRKRKSVQDSSNDNARAPQSEPSKPALQPTRKVQPPAAPVEDAIFSAPKTIEEIRAQKKAKTETKSLKSKPPARKAQIPTKAPASTRAVKENNGESKPVVNTEQELPEQDIVTGEEEDIGDFDVDDDDFEAQMRALEDAL